jgi:phytoene desaturase
VRRVTGPTDSVVVVGAGLGGLSAALRLAGAGRSVTVLERADVPGGRAGLWREGGYAIDTGPTVLTMPGLIADALDCVGESMDDWLTLDAVEPVYRAQFADGSALDVHSSVDAMAEEVRRVCGPAAESGYRRLVPFLAELYRLEMREFIDRNLDSPLDLVSSSLARLVALGGLRRLAPRIAEFLPDERLQRVFSFQAMYAGVSPFEALALYAVIGYMDSVAGVTFPRGGMHAVPRALAGAAERHGVTFRFGENVSYVEMRGDRAVAAVTSAGERLPCDVVVLNPDLPVARRMAGRPLRRPMRWSPSCFLLLAGAAYPSAPVHHTISFGEAWRTTFDELLGGRLMSDPSFLVSCPTTTDPSLAPDGRSAWSVLFPTPHLGGEVDWASTAPRYLDHVLATLDSRGLGGFAGSVEVQRTTTPLDWHDQGLARGTPFAAAHTFAQTGPFRPGNLLGENVVLTGSGTQPGVGVPMVLISGRLAAERITGPDPSYRSRTWP